MSADQKAIAALTLKPIVDLHRRLTTYCEMPDLRCVWTDMRIRASGFDVDHAIPFSLWRCNDLWNLLPANPKVNNRKRDRLSTVGLVTRASERIIACWRHVASIHERRFDREMTAFLGEHPPHGGWEKPAIARLKEAVEVTAIQLSVGSEARFDGN